VGLFQDGSGTVNSMFFILNFTKFVQALFLSSVFFFFFFFGPAEELHQKNNVFVCRNFDLSYNNLTKTSEDTCVGTTL
jgi:hypothetical protein